MIDALQQALTDLSKLAVNPTGNETPDQMRTLWIEFTRKKICIVRPVLRHLDPKFAASVRTLSKDIEACILSAKSGRRLQDSIVKRFSETISPVSNDMINQVENALIQMEKSA